MNSPIKLVTQSSIKSQSGSQANSLVKPLVNAINYFCLWLLNEDKRPAMTNELFQTFSKYRFLSEWRVKAKAQEVYDILADDASLPIWWPAVYLQSKALDAGEIKSPNRGLGRIVAVKAKGFLPYLLDLKYRIVEVKEPSKVVVEAWGDLFGRGEWNFKQDGDYVDITYDWRITPEKKLIKYLSFVLKPVFAANHKWAMQKGQQSLKLELLRRRAKNKEQLAKIPAPPRATTQSPIPLLLCVGVGVWLTSKLFSGVFNRKK